MVGAAYFLSDKPKVPKYPTVDIGAETGKAIQENLTNLPALADLTGRINQISTDQLNASLERMLPGYAKTRDVITGNLQAGLAGRLPAGVEQEIQRDIAEQGQIRGTGGASGFDTADFLRTLGLNKLAYAQQSLDSASRWLAQARASTPVFDFTRMFEPIEQRISLRAQENQAKFQRDWLRNKISSIPWGVKGFSIDAINAITQDVHTWGQMMAGYGSSMIGGGGGGGGAGGFGGNAGSMMGGGGGGGRGGFGQFAPSGSETPSYMSMWG